MNLLFVFAIINGNNERTMHAIARMRHDQCVIGRTRYEERVNVVEAPKLPERYQFSEDFFYSNLVTEMNKSNQRQFVHFYTPKEANNTGMNNPHQYIGLDFLDFTVGTVRESKTTQEVKRENVPIEVEINGRKTTANTTVTANFTTYRREIISGENFMFASLMRQPRTLPNSGHLKAHTCG